jgi:AcrR family transcriptional regulator
VSLTTRDRRSELRARTRASILDSARALIAERSGPRFSVDELAERADVARRTVFNHFASVDDVLLAVCAETLAVVVDDFLDSVSRMRESDGSRASMFDELAAVMHASDLPTAIATMVQVTGGPAAADAHAADLAAAAFSRVEARLLLEVGRRHPAADPLDVELLVGSLMHGTSVIAKHWIARTAGRVDDASRAEWERLLSHLVHSLRSGYLLT